MTVRIPEGDIAHTSRVGNRMPFKPVYRHRGPNIEPATTPAVPTCMTVAGAVLGPLLDTTMASKGTVLRAARHGLPDLTQAPAPIGR